MPGRILLLSGTILIRLQGTALEGGAEMMIEQLLSQLRARPETVVFQAVIDVIDANYAYTPVEFNNGGLVNPAGQNAGSCRIFGFAKLHKLTQLQTLHCFGEYYRHDVLKHPAGDDHQNIRHFMRSGWPGVSFAGLPLVLKKT